MGKHIYALICLAVMLSLNMAFSYYWFQFGARGGSSALNNNGAGITIQTVVPQDISDGSIAFWVGEDLSNGAFIQIGYLIENQSGEYPSLCTQSSCSGYQQLTAGEAEWFYEYFPSSSFDTFLGAIGPDGSAGSNGTFNNYSFYSTGKTWTFAFNGNVIGNVTLGTSSSGQNSPIAFGEIANTTTASQTVNHVEFKNLGFYQNGQYLLVPKGYSYVGYGVGSSTQLSEPYGVMEVANKINNFITGSNLPKPQNNTQLWTLGYLLSIISKYGNVKNVTEYFAYSSANISAPQILYTEQGSRGIFVQWKGLGYGSYSGTSNQTTVFMGSNITEQMVFQQQYLLNVSSKYGSTSGGGWYNANSTATYSVNSNTIYQNASSRHIFEGWSTGERNLSGSVELTGPKNASADWMQQYLINATSDYGNVLGSGWHDINSVAELSLTNPIINISGTERMAFYSWNNGSKSRNISLSVKSPLTLHALYKKQYLITLQAVDGNGNPINATDFSIDNSTYSGPAFIYSGVQYNVQSAYYKGFKLAVNNNITINSSSEAFIHLPLYPVYIQTTDLFGIPVNASVDLQLENGSQIRTYSGRNGTVVISDAPYGDATGSAMFFGINQSISSSGGTVVHLLYISLFDIEVFITAIVISALLYIIISRTVHRRKDKKDRASSQSLEYDKKQ